MSFYDIEEKKWNTHFTAANAEVYLLLCPLSTITATAASLHYIQQLYVRLQSYRRHN